MMLCTCISLRSLRERARRCTITNASAMMLSTVPAYLVSTTGSVGVAVPIDAAMQIICDLRNQCIYTCSSPLRWQSDLYSSNTATNGEMIGLGTNALMSKLEHVVRTLANTRTYSRHLTAASWKLWCRLVSTVDMLFNAVSMNMAFN